MTWSGNKNRVDYVTVGQLKQHHQLIEEINGILSPLLTPPGMLALNIFSLPSSSPSEWGEWEVKDWRLGLINNYGKIFARPHPPAVKFVLRDSLKGGNPGHLPRSESIPDQDEEDPLTGVVQHSEGCGGGGGCCDVWWWKCWLGHQSVWMGKYREMSTTSPPPPLTPSRGNFSPRRLSIEWRTQSTSQQIQRRLFNDFINIFPIFSQCHPCPGLFFISLSDFSPAGEEIQPLKVVRWCQYWALWLYWLVLVTPKLLWNIEMDIDRRISGYWILASQ